MTNFKSRIKAIEKRLSPNKMKLWIVAKIPYNDNMETAQKELKAKYLSIDDTKSSNWIYIADYDSSSTPKILYTFQATQ